MDEKIIDYLSGSSANQNKSYGPTYFNPSYNPNIKRRRKEKRSNSCQCHII